MSSPFPTWGLPLLLKLYKVKTNEPLPTVKQERLRLLGSTLSFFFLIQESPWSGLLNPPLFPPPPQQAPQERRFFPPPGCFLFPLNEERTDDLKHRRGRSPPVPHSALEVKGIGPPPSPPTLSFQNSSTRALELQKAPRLLLEVKGLFTNFPLRNRYCDTPF